MALHPSRFSSPSQFSMDLASKFLEDEEFVGQFLQDSHARLYKSRLHTEKLLRESNIKYHNKGYEHRGCLLFTFICVQLLTPFIEMRVFSSGSTSRLIFVLLIPARKAGPRKGSSLHCSRRPGFWWTRARHTPLLSLEASGWFIPSRKAQ